MPKQGKIKMIDIPADWFLTPYGIFELKTLQYHVSSHKLAIVMHKTLDNGFFYG